MAYALNESDLDEESFTEEDSVFTIPKKEVPMNQILEMASQRLALRGVLVGERTRDCMKQVVLDTPLKVVTMRPQINEIEKVLKFSSMESLEDYIDITKNLGVGANIGCRPALEPNGEFLFNFHKRKNVNEELRQTSSSEFVLKSYIYHFRSCRLVIDELKLSQETLSQLKLLEKQISLRKDWESIKGMCDQFFTTYGSHINLGLLHLGGIIHTYEFSTQSRNCTIQSKSKIKKYFDFGALFGLLSYLYVGSNAQKGKKHSSLYDKLLEEKKECYCVLKIGGPIGVDEVSDWRKLLKEDPLTWTIIDREIGESNFVPIWKVIADNHRREFSDYENLANCLMDAWVILYNEGIPICRQNETTAKAVMKVNELSEEINSFETIDGLQGGIDSLEKILNLIEEIKMTTETSKFLKPFLSGRERKKRLPLVLLQFCDKEEQLRKENNLPKVKYLFRKILDCISDEDFSEKHKLLRWVERKNELEISPLEQSIPDLVAFLEKQILKMNKNTQELLDVKGKSELVSIMLTYKRSLTWQKKDNEIFFLKIVLRSLKADWENLRLKDNISKQDLEGILDIIDSHHQDFLYCKNSGSSEALQAFLIHILISSSTVMKHSLTEEEFICLISDLTPFLSDKLKEMLSLYASSLPFSWKKMLEYTKFLFKGGIPRVIEFSMDFKDLKEALYPLKNMFTKNSCLLRKPTNQSKAKYSELLSFLRLDQYFPSKITVNEAFMIKTSKSLPWYFINELLMKNFKARDYFIHPNAQTEIDTIDFLSWELDEKMDDLVETPQQEKRVSTLDVLITILECCDSFLKQILFQRLSECKLAVPFLYEHHTSQMMFPLWCLRGITVSSTGISGCTRIMRAVDLSVPVFTFVRLGRPSFSKSQLLNYLINNNTHNTFLHHDCPNGKTLRRVSNGLVECMWSILEDRNSESPRLFLNLRGDASLFWEQLNVLKQISSLIIMIADIKDLTNETHIKICQEIIEETPKSALFLTSKNGTSKEDLKTWGKAVSLQIGKDLIKKVKQFTYFPEIQNTINISTVKEQIQSHLSENTWRYQNLRTVKDLMNKQNILIDENDKDCNKGMVHAVKLFSLMQGKKKEELFPLQMGFWKENGKLLKELNRMDKSYDNADLGTRYIRLNKKMDDNRMEQLKILNDKMSPAIKQFLLAINELSASEDQILFFLEWLKQALHDNSRYETKNIKCQTHENESLWQPIDARYYLSYDTQTKHSYCLENVLREVGLIFETSIYKSTLSRFGNCYSIDVNAIILQLHMLPELAAELLIRGVPLELVDGEASNVATEWVKAVLKNLAKTTNNARIFIVSVFGIQSSGKSTLLNTMFGLQLSVSTGRCTIGAYLQLVPVDSRDDLPFDYLFIIDTEGLRSPERKSMMLKHDNELATLIIGLGDLTLINVKGENETEMKEVLQIAIQAFLRMKAVEDKLNSQRLCVFVYQNVSGGVTDENLWLKRKELQKNLDFITKEAAEEEQVPNISTFSQIISFDIEKNIYFFPDLWLGVPPMAPISSAYSEHAKILKKTLLEDIIKTRRVFLTVSDFSIRLDDMWNAILTEDFVFNFRNTLEVKAYNNLERKFSALLLDLEEETLLRIRQAKSKLTSYESINDLEVGFQDEEKEILCHINTKFGELKLSLDQYFKESDMKELIIQWKQTKFNSLSLFVEEQKTQKIEELKAFKSSCRIDLDQKENKERIERKIQERASKLAQKLKDENCNKEEEDKYFEDMWLEIKGELLIPTLNQADTISFLVEKAIFESFPSHAKLIKNEMELQTHKLIQEEKILDIFPLIHTNDIEFTKMPRFDSARPNSLKVTMDDLSNTLSGKISDFFISERNCFDKIGLSHIKKLINLIKDEIDICNQNNRDFKMSHRLKVKLVVMCVCILCKPRLIRNEKLYNEKYSIEAKLNKYKRKCKILFSTEMRDSSEEAIAKDLLLEHLEDIICDLIGEEVTIAFHIRILHKMKLKCDLIFAILKDLADSNDFIKYIRYIKNPEAYAFQWMNDYIIKAFTKKGKNGTSEFEELVVDKVKILFKCLYDSLNTTSKDIQYLDEITMDQWVTKFCENLKNFIGVRKSALSLVSKRKVTRVETFQQMIYNELDALEQRIATNTLEKFTYDHKELWTTLLCDDLMAKLWGCPATCPFCGESCQKSDKNHYREESKDFHSCGHHKPEGLKGVKWKHNQRLSTNTCNFNVSCNYKYSYGQKTSNHRPFWKKSWKKPKYLDQYKKYKLYFPEWHIPSDITDSTSKYWKWCMAKYKNELSEYYMAEPPEIPIWWNITKEEALKDLQNVYSQIF